MSTKLRFKLIGCLIVLSLTGIVISQGFWLKRLYLTLNDQKEKEFTEALRMAEYKELFVRIKEYRHLGDSVQYSRSFSVDKPGGDPVISEDTYDTPQKGSLMIRMWDNPEEEEQEEKESIVDNLEVYLQQLNKMEDYILYAMHYDVDLLSPFDFEIYNQFLKESLEEKELLVPYQLEWMASETNSIIQRQEVQLSGNDFYPKNRITEIVYHMPVKEKYQMKLYLSFPQRITIKEMTGILLTSFLLVILVIFAFLYLLRTILRQKTIEELKTDFTNNMTHELKTPVTVAFAATDALLNYDETVNHKQKKYLTIVQEQLTHLSGLIEQILTLSVEERATFKLHIEEINIQSLVSILMDQQELKTNKILSVKSDIPIGFTIKADRTHVYNILTNLLENAIKYTEAEPIQIVIKGWEKEKEKFLSIADNGIGITEDAQSRIFDKFYRVPQGNRHNAKGYGLGLFYVKDIMEKQGGIVFVNSIPGKGSEFILCFKEK